MKKILLICNISQNFITFRKGLIISLLNKGYKVFGIAFDDDYKEEIIKLGVEFYCLKAIRRGINPLQILRINHNYYSIINEIKPDIVFTFQLKPNTFGVLGAKKAGIKNIYSMVEGTGDPFTYNTFKWKIIRKIVCFLYRKSLKNSKKVFFLNNDDKKEFIDRKLVQESKCEIVHGIGVDLKRFNYRPIKNTNTFLMIARMLETKGVYEYCECARQVKKQYPNAVFNYLGGEDTVKLSDIKSYIDDGSINYLGTTTDVRPYIEDSVALVLSSFYREGLPATIMEAEAIGRMVITTNNVGCRDTVIEGENGFLVPVKDVDKLAKKIIWCIEHPNEVEEMGKNARKFAEKHFNQIEINKKILSVIEDE